MVRKELLPGIFFIACLSGSCAGAMAYFPEALRNVETPATEDIVKGKWAPKFEKALGDALPIGPMSRDLWGRAEYSAFSQGRRGVVVGDQGWLFTSEEFSCPADSAANLKENLSFIAATAAGFAAKNVKMVIALVPAKTRVFPEYLGRHALPGCRKDLYKATRDYLTAHRLPVTDLLAAMDAASPHDGLYLKTDTHWSPAGAALAAHGVAGVVGGLHDLSLREDRFSTTTAAAKAHTGDLTHYLPGVTLAAEDVTPYTTTAAVSVAGAGAMTGLLDDAPVPLVTLVGTSYSANADWNFAGFLKGALKTDVLNVAEEGQGPFVVMDKYLKGKAWQENPPRLIVWEIPERYLLFPHGVAPP